MSNDMDVEETLRRYRTEPAAEVKAAVLARYARKMARRTLARRAGGFWRRPVPLYVVAAAVLIAAGLSFLAAGKGPLHGQPVERPRHETPLGNASLSPELEWEVTPNDLI